MAPDVLSVHRDLLPDAKVGEEVVVQVRALVTKVEAEIIDASAYEGRAYLPGEIRVDLIVMGLQK